jgi:nucleoside-diphosphate-sugar epimerase
MRVVVVGATGHVGGYLVPRLVRAGHEVIAISRGEHKPYRSDAAWSQVTRIVADREAEDAAGTFGDRVAALAPDVVIDMVCFTLDSARALVESLRGTGAILISCGTIWVHGTLVTVPAREDDPRTPWGDYGVGKSQIEDFLLAESRRPDGVRSIVLRPGHISGPGWKVINPIGNIDLDVWEKLAIGAEILLPGTGLATVHHVHADDVAQAFMLAIENSPLAVGLSFNIVSAHAVTLRGYAESVASWSGRDANIRYVSMDEFTESLAPASAETSLEHLSRSHSMSIERARRVLGYSPRYSSLEAVAEAVDWLRADGQIA